MLPAGKHKKKTKSGPTNRDQAYFICSFCDELLTVGRHLFLFLMKHIYRFVKFRRFAYDFSFPTDNERSNDLRRSAPKKIMPVPACKSRNESAMTRKVICICSMMM